VGNGRILREKVFDRIWIQPAADDAGGALGVALLIWHQLLQNERKIQGRDTQQGSLLGPIYSDDEIRSFLDTTKATYEYINDDNAICERVANEISAGRVIGWFQGRMEFGPRALGSRSILGDARNKDMQVIINQKVKFRENFRPFAPVVLREHVSEYFEMAADHESPYMLLVAPVHQDMRLPLTLEESAASGLAKLNQNRSKIPSVTHVDFSARVQTIDAERHGMFHTLLEAFYHKTGCPVMINTSLNLGWDPIVCSPQDAYETFMSSDIDVLCMGHYTLTKSAQAANIQTSTDKSGKESLADLLVSPCHLADLAFENNGAVCTECGHQFNKEDGIWQMFWPHDNIDAPGDVTQNVKAFYEETPFPNYDDHETVRSLLDKARQGAYARALDRSIPYNNTVLEVGCGTGQLSNFLGISCRRIVGVDLCLNSLRLGNRFREEHQLNRVRFLQMNLFRSCFRHEQFDTILCNGVLHHTADPFGGFQGLLPLLKPGGHIIVGLYNRYGRLMTDLRRQVFRVTGGRAKWIDPVLRNWARSQGKSKAWFADQYCHPHESKHTFGEVLQWFDETNIKFVRGVPSLMPGGSSLNGEGLFGEEPRGKPMDHFFVQAREVVAGSREGGFFIMIGRKPEDGGNEKNETH